MTPVSSPRFLSLVMLADAAVSLATGVAQIAAADTLSSVLRLPAALLSGTGWFFVVYSAVAATVGWLRPVPSGLVRLISLGNFGWAGLCVLALLGPWLVPTAAGVAWILGQALVVAVLAELQWLGAARAPGVLQRA